MYTSLLTSPLLALRTVQRVLMIKLVPDQAPLSLCVSEQFNCSIMKHTMKAWLEK